MTTHNIYTLSSTVATHLTENGVHSGKDITLQNVNDNGEIYIGGDGVTTSSYGYRLMPGHAISFELSGADTLYAVSESNGLFLASLSMNLETGN